MWGLSYWVLPLFSGAVWLAMLLAMLLSWLSDGKPHYPSMADTQHVAYISDVGAQKLKPLFIAMGSITVVVLDLAFLSERWLRHRGRLHQNTSRFQKGCSIVSIIAAIIGAAGLILLTIFDTLRHPRLHDVFLVVFIGGYIVSAIFICIEYHRLGVHHRRFRILRASFYIKLIFIFVELALAIAFGVSQNIGHYNIAAVLEWVISLIFTFYLWSFFIDFIPAVHTKHHQSRETAVEMAEDGPQPHSQTGLRSDGMTENVYPNVNANGYANDDVNKYATNGHPNNTGTNGNTYFADGHPNSLKPAHGHVPPASNF